MNKPPISRLPEQYDLLRQDMLQIVQEPMQGSGGKLGSPSSARRRTYERLKQYAASLEGTLFPPSQELRDAIDDIYRYPLRETARDMLNRQLRSGIDIEQLAQLVITLRAEDRR